MVTKGEPSTEVRSWENRGEAIGVKGDDGWTVDGGLVGLFNDGDVIRCKTDDDDAALRWRPRGECMAELDPWPTPVTLLRGAGRGRGTGAAWGGSCHEEPDNWLDVSSGDERSLFAMDNGLVVLDDDEVGVDGGAKYGGCRHNATAVPSQHHDSLTKPNPHCATLKRVVESNLQCSGREK